MTRKYSDPQLAHASIRDLINDYRCTTRDLADFSAVKYHSVQAMADLAEYAYKCREQAIALFHNRHGARPNRYGSFGIDLAAPEGDMQAELTYSDGHVIECVRVRKGA